MHLVGFILRLVLLILVLPTKRIEQRTLERLLLLHVVYLEIFFGRLLYKYHKFTFVSHVQ